MAGAKPLGARRGEGAQCRQRTHSAHSACSGSPLPGLTRPADAPSGCPGPVSGRRNSAGSPLAKKKRDSSGVRGCSVRVPRGPECPCPALGPHRLPATKSSMPGPVRGLQALALRLLSHTLDVTPGGGEHPDPCPKPPPRTVLPRKILTLSFCASRSSLSV